MRCEKISMKKRGIVLANILIIIVLVVFMETVEENNIQKIYNADENIVDSDTKPKTKTHSFNYDSKTAIARTEDGWVHFFSCEYEKGSLEPYVYIYNAYNLKHKYLEDYKIKVIDEKGTVLSDMAPSLPYIILDTDCFDEIVEVTEFLMEQKPTGILSEEQENYISVEYVDKELMIKLFNDMIMSDKLVDGKYAYLPEADIVTEEASVDGYTWQIGYFNSHGVILDVNIELVYEDASYLSDKAKDGTVSVEERELNQIIEDVESLILTEQCFSVDKEIIEGVDCVDVMRLSELLQTIEQGGY